MVGLGQRLRRVAGHADAGQAGGLGGPTPVGESSTATALAGSTPSRSQASRYTSGAGLGATSSPVADGVECGAERRLCQDLVDERAARVGGEGQGHASG